MSAQYGIGDFRSWLARREFAVGSILEEYTRVATLASTDERAYCVAQGISAGCIELSFGLGGYTNCLYIDLPFEGSVVSLHGYLPFEDSVVSLRPYVIPFLRTSVGYAVLSCAVDVFPSWPAVPFSVLDDEGIGAVAHCEAREAHLACYFDHFAAEGLDRRTLVWLEGVPR